MFHSVQEAVQAIQSRSSDQSYLEACEYLVAHRAELTQRVFIELPGGLRGNDNPIWDKVKENSEERCTCGNERIINPLNLRSDFISSAASPVVISKDNPVYLKPLGGDKRSAYFKLEIGQSALIPTEDPFAPLVLSVGLFTQRGFLLKDIAKMVAETPDIAVLYTKVADVPVPAILITAVDLEVETITAITDVAVEAFDPDSMVEHACESHG